MAPTAITVDSCHLDSTSSLTKAGINQTITKTAPSLDKNGTSQLAELAASKLTVTPSLNPHSVPEPNSAEVWSQRVTTDHMLTCTWTATTGWQAPHLQPYGPFSIMPTASVLHYATECFEGMKAYRGYDGKLRLFRPEKNCKRMLKSATRIALPAFDPAELQKLVESLVAMDGPKWLPRERKGTFLYLRPTMIATAPAIGVQKPFEAMLFIIAVMFPPLDDPSAAPPSLAQVNRPKAAGMKLLASNHDMIRAWPGGFGNAKVGANYGPSLVAQAEARQRGYDQILWLFGEDCLVTEAGASNFFVVWKNAEGKVELVTAPLGDGIILEGVTRCSVLDMARERLGEEVTVVERKFTMDEVVKASEEGRLLEAFASGTAVSTNTTWSAHDPTDICMTSSSSLPSATSTSAAKISASRWLKANPSNTPPSSRLGSRTSCTARRATAGVSLWKKRTGRGVALSRHLLSREQSG